ncbi:hypothetical protein CDAR_308391 [Caerostris darwini]|uniref:Uncharacterized protein n=1 Tax=Caerostris darwini TaxID=1538125 RepID=A0AAV4TSR9_9ARAC|nr:hypothetical protein CDAR_308391 [Caerostris darwini]
MVNPGWAKLTKHCELSTPPRHVVSVTGHPSHLFTQADGRFNLLRQGVFEAADGKTENCDSHAKAFFAFVFIYLRPFMIHFLPPLPHCHCFIFSPVQFVSSLGNKRGRDL